MIRTLSLSSQFKIMHIAGVDAEKFLQSQFTNGVKQATGHQIQWQAYCTRDGLVHSIFGLWREENNFYLLLASDLIEKTQELLQKYAKFSKVAINNLSNTTIELCVETSAVKNINWAIKKFDGTHLQLTWQTMLAECADDFACLRATLIDHDFPWLCLATSGCFRPHEINLPALQIVNFKKGCFPGQEIIARMQYRGKPKQGFYRFHLQEIQNLLPGQNIFREEKKVGQIIDAINLADHTVLSMVLQHEWCEKTW